MVEAKTAPSGAEGEKNVPGKQKYSNESIVSLKGADRVRKRPAVIFGSDGADGCAHSIFEILSNAIDEAREGFGDRVVLTRFKDGSIQVEDFGRGIPVDYNPKEQRYNWELVFCEMYAGGKYSADGDNYEYSLGLNGLGLCATQYASEWMTADIWRDGFHYHLDFKRGEPAGEMRKEPAPRHHTGSTIRWKPDDQVFTDVNVPAEYFAHTMRQQAVVNAGLTLELVDETGEEKTTARYYYEKGIEDYVNEMVGLDGMTPVVYRESTATARDREDQPEYKVKMTAAFCFSNRVQLL